MELKLLEQLSNSDAIAAHETNVRDIIKQALPDYSDTFRYDGIGSLMVTKAARDPNNSPTIIFAAHMDEVGFLLRNISDIGMGYLAAVGNVEDRAKINQLVRATTKDGKRIEGILNVERDRVGSVTEMYVDFGFDSKEEFMRSGLDIGDMVCFASDFRQLAADRVVAGKAMDDRVGCFALINALNEIKNDELHVNVVGAFTSSEEVGTRGGRLVSHIVHPDVFFAVDVAKHPELDRGFKDHRRLGYGPMLEYYDKTMVPNPRLLRFIEEVASTDKLSYQKDMFKGGGTDAGSAHLENDGVAAAVLGFPLRYCHDPYSLANTDDMTTLTALIVAISRKMKANTINDFYAF